MKIELEFPNDFIATKMVEGMARSAAWWIDTKNKDIDELELKVQKMLELAPDEIVEVDLEKAVNGLAWARDARDEWKAVEKQLEKIRPSQKGSDLIKKAKALLK